MALELPALSAVVARLENPKVELAAYGGVILSIALVIESPIIMLLSASTTLSRDRASYRSLSRFTHRCAALLTALHLLIATTPLYEVVVGGLLGAPPSVVEAARLGFLIMTPWTWAIAYRRFNQGVLIRFGYNRAVTTGTAIRLGVNLIVLWTGWLGPLAGEISGATLAATAVASGVVAEAIFSGFRVAPVVAEYLGADDPEHSTLRGRAFFDFYAPLALTTMVALFAQPLASAGVARMPEALASLAAIPVVIGLVFMLQSQGLALAEVVLSGLERPGAEAPLFRFSLLLSGATGLVLLAFAATPLAGLWFGRLSGLDAEFVVLAQTALWFCIPIPMLRAIQSWLSAVLVHARETRAVSEAVVAFLVTASLVLAAGVLTQRWNGLYVAMFALALGRATQTLWLWVRSRGQVAALFARGAGTAGTP